MANLPDWRSFSKIDPDLEELLKARGPIPEFHDFSDVSDVRNFLASGKARLSKFFGRPENVREQDYQVVVHDGTEITCRVYSPETAPNGGSALAVIYHGGGFCLGGLSNEELLCRLLVSKLGMVCVNVDYRLAPEHPFPTGLGDAYDTAKWAASNASALGADPSKGFVLGGSSAGGNFATVTTLRLRDEGFSPPVTGCHLMAPVLCYGQVMPSQYAELDFSSKQNKDAPILNEKGMKFFYDMYIPNEADRSSPLFSPLIWPSGLADFPRTYLQICGMDALRDQELIFERRLREECGIATKVDIYQGVPHGFWSAFPNLPATRQFVDDYTKGVGWILHH